mmetsp:Transcript_18316/g.22719  ORF Transcript_18316/g.22719 Transcript_18316/m.22719 type:complete len:86 (+) Transcript_18316:1070-1327(+)
MPKWLGNRKFRVIPLIRSRCSSRQHENRAQVIPHQESGCLLCSPPTPPTMKIQKVNSVKKVFSQNLKLNRLNILSSDVFGLQDTY